MASLENDACTNYPDFAVICSFIENFGEKLNVTLPNIGELQTLLEDSEDVNPLLAQTIAYLLRRIKRTIKLDKWEKCLQKFAHSYSYEDAWELEHSGFKKAKLEIKIRVLKNLFEKQFDLHKSFKEKVNLLSAKQLRLQPCGRDKLGVSYWCQKDEFANLRIYKDDQDEETWALVAKSREELVNLIEKLQAQIPQKLKRETSVEESQSETTTPMILSRAPTPLDSTFHTPEASSNSSPAPDTTSVSVQENIYVSATETVQTPSIASTAITSMETDAIVSSGVTSIAKITDAKSITAPQPLETAVDPSIKDSIATPSLVKSVKPTSVMKNISAPSVTQSVTPAVTRTTLVPQVSKTEIESVVTAPIVASPKLKTVEPTTKAVGTPPISTTVVAPVITKTVVSATEGKTAVAASTTKTLDTPQIAETVMASAVKMDLINPIVSQPIVTKAAVVPSIIKTISNPPVVKTAFESTVAKVGIEPQLSKVAVTTPINRNTVVPLVAKSVIEPTVTPISITAQPQETKTDVELPVSKTEFTSKIIKTGVVPPALNIVAASPVAETVARPLTETVHVRPAAEIIVTSTAETTVAAPSVSKIIPASQVTNTATAPATIKTQTEPPSTKTLAALPVAGPVLTKTVAESPVTEIIAAPPVTKTVIEAAIKKADPEPIVTASLTKDLIKSVIEPIAPKSTILTTKTTTRPTLIKTAITSPMVGSNLSKIVGALPAMKSVTDPTVIKPTDSPPKAVCAPQLEITLPPPIVSIAGKAATVTKTLVTSPVTKTIVTPPVAKTVVTPPVAKTMVTPPVEKTAVSPPVAKTVVTPPVAKTIVTPPVAKTVVTPPVAKNVVTPPITKTVVIPPVAKTVVTPPVAETVVSPPVAETVVSPPVAENVIIPPVAKTAVTPTVAKTVVTSSVAKTVSSPPVAKTGVSPPVAKTVVSPPVAKTVVCPPIAKTGVTSPIGKTVAIPPASKTVVTPAMAKTVVTPPIAKTVITPPVAKTVITPPAENTIVAPPIAKTVVAPSVAKTLGTSPVAQTLNTSPVAKTVATPPVAKTVVTPPVAKTVVTPPVAKTVVTPPVAKTVVTPPIAKTVVAPPVAKTVVTPPVAKTVVTPPVAKTIVTPPDVRTVVTPPIAKTIVTPPVPKTIVTPPDAKTVIPPAAKTVIPPAAKTIVTPSVAKTVTPPASKTVVKTTVGSTVFNPVTKEVVAPTVTKTVVNSPVTKVVGTPPGAKTAFASPVINAVVAPPVAISKIAPPGINLFATTSEASTTAAPAVARTEVVPSAALCGIESLVTKTMVTPLVTKTDIAPTVTKTVDIPPLTTSVIAPPVTKATGVPPLAQSVVAPPVTKSTHSPVTGGAVMTSITKGVVASPVMKNVVAAPVTKNVVAAPVMKNVVAAPVMKNVVAAPVMKNVVAPPVIKPDVASIDSQIAGHSVTKTGNSSSTSKSLPPAVTHASAVISEVPKIDGAAVQKIDNYYQQGKNKPPGDVPFIQKEPSLDPSNEQKDYKSRVKEKESTILCKPEIVAGLKIDKQITDQLTKCPGVETNSSIFKSEKTDFDKSKIKPVIKDTVSQKSKLEKILDKFAAKTASDASKNLPIKGSLPVNVQSTENLSNQSVVKKIPSLPKDIESPLNHPSGVEISKGAADKGMSECVEKVCTSSKSLLSLQVSHETISKDAAIMDEKQVQEGKLQPLNLVKPDVVEKIDEIINTEGNVKAQQTFKYVDKFSLIDGSKKESSNLPKDSMHAVSLSERAKIQDSKTPERKLHDVPLTTKDLKASTTLPASSTKPLFITDMTHKLADAKPAMKLSESDEKKSKASETIVSSAKKAEKATPKIEEKIIELTKKVEENRKVLQATSAQEGKVKDSLSDNEVQEKKDEKCDGANDNLKPKSVSGDKLIGKMENVDDLPAKQTIAETKIDKNTESLEIHAKNVKEEARENLTKDQKQSTKSETDVNISQIKNENKTAVAATFVKQPTLMKNKVLSECEKNSQSTYTIGKDLTDVKKTDSTTDLSSNTNLMTTSLKTEDRHADKIESSEEIVKKPPKVTESEINVGTSKTVGNFSKGIKSLTKPYDSVKEISTGKTKFDNSSKDIRDKTQSLSVNIKEQTDLQKDHMSTGVNLKASEMTHERHSPAKETADSVKSYDKLTPLLEVKPQAHIPSTKAIAKETSDSGDSCKKVAMCESYPKLSSNKDKLQVEETLNVGSSSHSSEKASSNVDDKGLSNPTANTSRPKVESAIVENKNDTIEEPVMIVRGDGEGAQCDSENPPAFERRLSWWKNFDQTDDQPGPEISEEVQYFWGDGSGADCNAGNSGDEADNAIESKIPPNTSADAGIPDNSVDPNKPVGGRRKKVNGVNNKEEGSPAKMDTSPVRNNKGTAKRTRSLSKESKNDSQKDAPLDNETDTVTEEALKKEEDPEHNVTTQRGSRSKTSQVNSKVSDNRKCKSDDSEESDTGKRPAKKGRGRGRPKRGRPARQSGKSYEDQESDEEMEQSYNIHKPPVKPQREAPRQRSARIAKIREREETERRELEAIRMKQLSEENKQNELEMKAREDRRSTREIKKDKKEKKKDKSKKRKKKKKKSKVKNGSHPWAHSSSSSSSSSEEEELLEVEDEENEELVFKSDHEFSPESDIGEEDAQPIKRARTARKVKTEERPVKKEEAEKVESDFFDDTKCAKCAHQDHPETILLCDLCDAGWHLSCLLPPLLSVPEGDWTCPSCEHLALIEKLKEILQDYDSIKKRADNEEQRRQRLAYINVSLDNVLPDKRPSKDQEDEYDSETDSQDDESGSDESSSVSSSSSGRSSESGPLYTLRARPSRTSKEQVEDFDHLINEAIRDEMEAAMVGEKSTKLVTPARAVASVGRGKDISNIMDGEQEEDFDEDKESESDYEPEEQAASAEVKSTPLQTQGDNTPEPKELEEDSSRKRKRSQGDESDEESKDDESVEYRSRASMLASKKRRRLTDLDAIEDEDDSDEDFKGSSADESEDESAAFSSAMNTDSDSENSNVKSKRRRHNDSQPLRRSSRNQRNLPSDYDSEPERMIRRAGVKKRRINDTTTDEDDFSSDSDSYGRHKPKRRARPRQAARNARRGGRCKRKGGGKAAAKKKKLQADKGDPKPRVRYSKPKKVEETPEEIESKRRVTRGRQINFCDTLFISEEEEESDEKPKSRGKVMKGERHQPDSSDYEESGDEMKKRRGVSGGKGKGKVMKDDDEDDDSDYEPTPRSVTMSKNVVKASEVPMESEEEVKPPSEEDRDSPPALPKLVSDATVNNTPVSHAVASLIAGRPDPGITRPRIEPSPRTDAKSYPSPGYVPPDRAGRVGEPQIHVASSPVPVPMIAGSAVSITPVSYVPNPAAAIHHPPRGHIPNKIGPHSPLNLPQHKPSPALGPSLAGSPKHNSDPHGVAGKAAATAVLPVGRQSPGPKWGTHMPTNSGTSPRHGMATPPRGPMPPNLNSSPPPPYRSSPIPSGYPHYPAPEHYPGHPGFPAGYHTPRHPMVHAVYGPPGSHPGYPPHHGGVLRGPPEIMRHPNRGSPNHSPHPLAMKSNYPGLEPMPYRGSPTPMDASMRHGSPGAGPEEQHREPAPKTSAEEKGEFSSGLMSYFSSQREDVD